MEEFDSLMCVDGHTPFFALLEAEQGSFGCLMLGAMDPVANGSEFSQQPLRLDPPESALLEFNGIICTGVDFAATASCPYLLTFSL